MLISLGQLAGQLGGFVGQSESVKKAVVKAIIAVINNNPSLKNDLNDLYSPHVTKLSESDKSAGQAVDTGVISELQSKVSEKIKHLEQEEKRLESQLKQSLPSPSPSAELAKLHSKLDALEKVKELCEKYENLKTSKDEPKKLLDNLCDGLQTFLGFNKDSKGYDGTGIVYSDLDRLCDAVMAFLSGVLSNIHKHLGQHKDAIQPAIESLNKNKHLGKIGFNAAIEKVVAGVRGYNEKVRESNEKVKRPIKKLQADLNNKFEEKVSAILPKQHENAPTEIGHAVSRAVSLVEECKSFARVFFSNMRKAEEDFKAISYLNDECKNNVNNARDNIFHEAEMLNRWSSKGKEWKDFKTVESLIQSTLTSLGNCVNTDITEKITAFVDELKKKTSAILKELQRIDKQLWESVLSLEDWMKLTKSDITFLQKDVDKILEEVKWGDRGEKSANRQNLEAAAMTLRGKAEELYQAGKAAKEKVAETVRSALAQVKSMDDALKKDLYEVKGEIKKAITALGETLKKNVNQDLGTLKGKIKSGLDPIVENSKTFSEQFNATQKTIYEAIRTVDGDLQKLRDLKNLESIDPRLGEGTKLLHAIHESKAFEAVSEYFTKLDSEVMEKVNEAMKGIGTVIGAMYSHSTIDFQTVDLKSIQPPKISTVTIGGDLVKGIPDLELSEHTTAIEEVLGQASSIKTLSKGTLEKLLAKFGAIALAVSDHSRQVVAAVMKKLQEKVNEEVKSLATAINTKVSSIKNGIDKHEQNVSEQYGTSVTQDKSRGLQALVKNFETSIQNKLTNLQGDINKKFLKNMAGGIGEHDYDLPTVMTTFHGTYEKRLKTATVELNGNTDVLTNQIGKDGMGSLGKSSKISELGDKFDNYKKQVNQGSLTNPDVNKLTGSLPKAIGAIKTAVEKTLEQVQKINGEADDQLREVDRETHRLCDTVRRAGRDVNSGLNDLIDGKIEEQLSKIKGQIEALHHTLESVVVVNTKKLLTYAENAGKQITTQLTKHVNDIIKQATDKLITTLRKNYVTSARDALTTFGAKINSELEKLPAAIDRDSTIGFKGFLHKFSNTFLEEASRINNITTESRTGLKEAAEHLSKGFQRFYPILSLQDEVEPYAAELQSVFGSVDSLVRQIITSMHFDHLVLSRLSASEIDFTSFTPETFSDAPKTSLWPLKMGFLGFNAELQKAYVSTYSRQDWDEEEQGKYAKVCLSIVPIVTDALNDLKEKLDNDDGKWKKYEIYNSGESHHSLHRLFFSQHGYDPGLPVGSKHGELNHRTECDGERILSHLNDQKYKLFVTSTQSHAALRSDTDVISVEEVKEGGLLSDLFSYLTTYFRVCHLGAPSKNHPCSVNEMLCWLTGLPHNGVYEKLKGHVETLFQVPDKSDPSKKNAVSIEASPQSITHDNVHTVIGDICAKSYALLTTFVGTGDEATYYACEFPNNTLGLQYPSNPADCLDTLLDILRRIFPPLKFLFMQCGQPAAESGWLKCVYGKDVKSSKWPCKEHSKAKSKCEPKCQPTCGPNDQPNCQPTSPLQSYLSDSLTGHLPHSLTSIGCKAECNTCPNGKPGMPCITPLGFRGFSGSTKTGSYLSAVIGDFLEIPNINTLFGLSPTTPKTLPEHFDFVSCLVRGWIDLSNSVGKSDVQYAFEASAKSLSIQLYDKPNELTDALRDAYGSESVSHRSCEHHHLLHLTSFETCRSNKKHCSPYMSPLCRDVYRCLPFKHSSTYLSWAIYLPWTFWDLLNNLYNAFCAINCQDWGCRGCLRGDKCKKGQHGVVDDENPNAICQCPSIVDCEGVAPTLYQFGFVFGEASTLNDKASPKKCSDFCSQLKYVLNSQYFKDLFKECDNFLWTIRTPFSYSVLALWSASFLYLLYVYIGRLDTLHIRSHLRIPASHKIAAQSLLAAARIGKLAKVSYLQP